MISVVIPAYNEGEGIVAGLCTLVSDHRPGQITVVDASNEDDFARVLSALKANCPTPLLEYMGAGQTGRASQMNQGAANSRGDILLFLHADTQLPHGAMGKISEALGQGSCWGRFDVRFDNSSWPFRLIAFMMNWRSRMSGIATGDQAIFMTQAAFEQVQGFDDIPLMEDIAMSRKLKKLGSPACLKNQVTTAARRWERKGVLKTVLLMWYLRLAFQLRVSPEYLADWYRK